MKTPAHRRKKDPWRRQILAPRIPPPPKPVEQPPADAPTEDA